MQVSEYRPTIVAFCCNWCSYAGADLSGTNRLSYPADVKIIRIPCSCRLNPLFILRAFQRGADGGKLNQYLRTVLALVHHALDLLQMADGARQTVGNQLLILVHVRVLVPMCMVVIVFVRNAQLVQAFVFVVFHGVFLCLVYSRLLYHIFHRLKREKNPSFFTERTDFQKWNTNYLPRLCQPSSADTA